MATPQLLTSATFVDGSTGNVAIDAEGRISGVGDHDGRSVDAGGEAVERIDLSGHVLLRAPVEPHAHLDKAFLSEQIANPSGDLLGAIEAMRANRHLLTVDETVERAERAARLFASNGYVAVRTHADLTAEHGLTSIEALGEVKRRVADVIDVEIVALTGWPVTGTDGARHRDLLTEAVDRGVDLVGGCPHLEPMGGDGTIAEATEVFLQAADDARLPVDLHTDETLDPRANGLDLLADAVLAGFDLPVTASHCVSLGQRGASEQAASAERVAAARVNVVALPHTNLYLQGRGHHPMPRALTAVRALREAGANLSAGADNLQDPFNPLGRACAFETAALMLFTCHLLPHEAWATVANASARTLGRDDDPSGDHGLTIGAPADLLAVPAESVREAIAFGPAGRRRWRAGVET